MLRQDKTATPPHEPVFLFSSKRGNKINAYALPRKLALSPTVPSPRNRSRIRRAMGSDSAGYAGIRVGTIDQPFASQLYLEGPNDKVHPSKLSDSMRFLNRNFTGFRSRLHPRQDLRELTIEDRHRVVQKNASAPAPRSSFRARREASERYHVLEWQTEYAGYST
jgi:hypothetical protein